MLCPIERVRNFKLDFRPVEEPHKTKFKRRGQSGGQLRLPLGHGEKDVSQ